MGTSYHVSAARLAQEHGPFRFDIGTKVECSQGAGIWKCGVVSGLYYREPQWPPERWMPYRVELEDGEIVGAPMDSDACIRLRGALPLGERQRQGRGGGEPASGQST